MLPTADQLTRGNRLPPAQHSFLDQCSKPVVRKVYTIIVKTNTRAGAMGEHSPCDALVPSIVADYVVTQSIIPESFSSPEPPSFFSERDLDNTGWERLDWVTDARIKAECIAAESRAESLISDSDDSVLWFSDYGTDWIKSIGTSGFHRPLSDADLVERI
jgi:hypothetical protein